MQIVLKINYLEVQMKMSIYIKMITHSWLVCLRNIRECKISKIFKFSLWIMRHRKLLMGNLVIMNPQAWKISASDHMFKKLWRSAWAWVACKAPNSRRPYKRLPNTKELNGLVEIVQWYSWRGEAAFRIWSCQKLILWNRTPRMLSLTFRCRSCRSIISGCRKQGVMKILKVLLT